MNEEKSGGAFTFIAEHSANIVLFFNKNV